jgi:hypothetical protein
VSEKVFWTESEKRSIASMALNIQRDRPDLSGLRLLKHTIKQLPKNRQRTVISLSQAEWFEPTLELEIRIRNAEEVTNDPHIQIQENTASAVEATKTLNGEVASFNARYLKLNEDKLEATVKLVESSTPLAPAINSLRSDHKEWREAHLELLGTVDSTLDTMRNDNLMICCLLRDILKELTALKHLAIGIPTILANRPTLTSTPLPLVPALQVVGGNGKPKKQNS